LFTCVPGCTVDATFAGRLKFRGIYDVILGHLLSLCPSD
jgi:hypothetical protein